MDITMMWTVRIIAAVLLFALMFVWSKIVHIIVGMSIIAGLLVMGLIFWAAFAFENRDRRLDGMPPYSWGDFRDDLVAIRKEMLMPMSILAAIGAAACFLR